MPIFQLNLKRSGRQKLKDFPIYFNKVLTGDRFAVFCHKLTTDPSLKLGMSPENGLNLEKNKILGRQSVSEFARILLKIKQILTFFADLIISGCLILSTIPYSLYEFTNIVKKKRRRQRIPSELAGANVAYPH